MKQNGKYFVIIFLLGTLVLGGTRVAYSRPGRMMRVPTSSNQKTPYLFRTGFSTEIHNYDPFNTAKGVYFDMEFGKGFNQSRFTEYQNGDHIEKVCGVTI